MKINSYPPFIVFFDTVVILLFTLMLNQNKDITFEIPKEDIFHGAQLVFENENQLYYVQNGAVVDTTTSDIFYMAPCKEQKKCIDASKKIPIGSVKILFPDTLTVEISKISTLSIKSGCSGFISIIGNNGKIDRHATFNKNSCMSSISGIDNWLNYKSN